MAHDRGPRLPMVPPGDDKVRLVCPECDYIAYQNPKIVVGAVCESEGRILLCRRAIEPRKGHWTLPAGYLELEESPADGAKREAFEEAGARIEIEGLLAVYYVPRISQVQMFYRASLIEPSIAPGIESLEVELVPLEQAKERSLAFPSVLWALTHHRESRGKPLGQPFGNPAGSYVDPVP